MPADAGWREPLEEGYVGGHQNHVESRQRAGRGGGVPRGGGAVARAFVEASQLELEVGLQPRQLGGIELLDGCADGGDGAVEVPVGRQHARPGGSGPSLQGDDVDTTRAVGQGLAGGERRLDVAAGQMRIDLHVQQLGGSQAIVADQPQPPLGRGQGEHMVAALEVKAGGRKQRLQRLLLAEQQGLGIGEATLPNPQVGQSDVGMPAGRADRRLEVGLGPHQDGLGLAPPPELHEQRGLHAVAVPGEEGRPRRLGANESVLAQEVSPCARPFEIDREVAGGEE